jgi:hypothetical protein
MEPLSRISPCTAGGAEMLSGGSIFLGLTRNLFTIAHTPDRPTGPASVALFHSDGLRTATAGPS